MSTYFWSNGVDLSCMSGVHLPNPLSAVFIMITATALSAAPLHTEGIPCVPLTALCGDYAAGPSVLMDWITEQTHPSKSWLWMPTGRNVALCTLVYKSPCLLKS